MASNEQAPRLRESPRLLRGHPYTYRAIASGVAGTGRLLDRREGGKDREPMSDCPHGMPCLTRAEPVRAILRRRGA
jgi:hypothetical protein